MSAGHRNQVTDAPIIARGEQAPQSPALQMSQGAANAWGARADIRQAGSMKASRACGENAVSDGGFYALVLGLNLLSFFYFARCSTH